MVEPERRTPICSPPKQKWENVNDCANGKVNQTIGHEADKTMRDRNWFDTNLLLVGLATACDALNSV